MRLAVRMCSISHATWRKYGVDLMQRFPWETRSSGLNDERFRLFSGDQQDMEDLEERVLKTTQKCQIRDEQRAVRSRKPVELGSAS